MTLVAASLTVQATPTPRTSLRSQTRTTCAGPEVVQLSRTVVPAVADCSGPICANRTAAQRARLSARAGFGHETAAGGRDRDRSQVVVLPVREEIATGMRETTFPCGSRNPVGSKIGLPARSSTGVPSQRNWSGFTRRSGRAEASGTSVMSTHWPGMPNFTRRPSRADALEGAALVRRRERRRLVVVVAVGVLEAEGALASGRAAVVEVAVVGEVIVAVAGAELEHVALHPGVGGIEDVAEWIRSVPSLRTTAEKATGGASPAGR